MPAVAEVPDSIRAATEEQAAARVALAAAAASPSHAYLLLGPAGAGKRAAARALAAELLADGAPDPEDARRRALLDPSPHPDLAWIRPPGAQHLVEEIRTRVIAASAYRPFEGRRRAFVIEAAEMLAEESQNALLKTLEEPAPGSHLILVSAEPEALLETVRSRCVPVRFTRLAPEAVMARLANEGENETERRSAARLASGDVERARYLLTEDGRALRAAAERLCVAARSGELTGSPWEALVGAAELAAEHAGERERARLAGEAEDAGETGAAARRRAREADEYLKRRVRSVRTATLDTGLGLVAAWLRDLAAVADGAASSVLNIDRLEPLAQDADGLDGRRARRGAELAMETRRRLQVNVNETLALEALAFRLEFLLAR